MVYNVTGPAQMGVVYGVPMEGTISPREQEAAQQMQQLHWGAGGGRLAAGREASADPEPGRALFAAAPAQPSAAGAAGFSEQQDTDAEREEYEDEGVDGDGLQ